MSPVRVAILAFLMPKVVNLAFFDSCWPDKNENAHQTAFWRFPGVFSPVTHFLVKYVYFPRISLKLYGICSFGHITSTSYRKNLCLYRETYLNFCPMAAFYSATFVESAFGVFSSLWMPNLAGSLPENLAALVMIASWKSIVWYILLGNWYVAFT